MKHSYQTLEERSSDSFSFMPVGFTTQKTGILRCHFYNLGQLPLLSCLSFLSCSVSQSRASQVAEITMIHGDQFTAHPKIDDPFAGYSLISLLPRTLGIGLHADSPSLEKHEMGTIKAVLQSIVHDGSGDVTEQAQTITKNCQNMVHSSLDGDNTIPAGGMGQPVGRRPVLGHSNSGMDINLNTLHDPEEFFRTAELLEKADQMHEKLKGVDLTELEKDKHITCRKRRSGIFPERTYLMKGYNAFEDFDKRIAESSMKYIHSDCVNDVDFSELDHIRDPVEFFRTFERLENADKVLKKLKGEVPVESAKDQLTSHKHCPESSIKGCSASQYLDGRIASSSNVSNKITTNENHKPNSLDQDAADDKEINTSDLLNKLMTVYKDLNIADGTPPVNEILQIETIEVGKLRLPEWRIIEKNDFETSKNRAMQKTSGDHQISQSSPTQKKIPPPAISVLQLPVSVNNLSENAHMSPQNDDSSNGDSCLVSCQQKMHLSPPVDVSSLNKNGFLARDASITPISDGERLSSSHKLQTPNINASKITHNISAEAEGAESACRPSESTIRDNHSEGFNKQKDDKGEDMQLDPLHDHLDFGVRDPTPGGMIKRRLACTFEISDEEHVLSGSGVDANRCGHNEELQIQLHGHCATSGMSQKTEEKEIVSGRNKNKLEKKMSSRRKSLANDGMKWESGVRRSTRIKHRPLEYWRGERFLYGRIHDSLATVIGVKYASPGNDALKVKSFVSAEYAELVTQVALH
ncbi:uncharacterized protein LOC122001270 isoform X1 [Zingiber officinale]|uniref:uncharacterized protein LOC122001270 isoform X1 n=2 Tax=Zingiber officinale TaxID=94328 RepID=UPI001C4DB857|nr:uncharacterized protein LOC122001270 isoform X1 [Zingiber officinale]XP_042411862.1 uncharacterized protein LOC122001270 isoform X1 [Zingiber officinale]